MTPPSKFQPNAGSERQSRQGGCSNRILLLLTSWSPWPSASGECAGAAIEAAKVRGFDPPRDLLNPKDQTSSKNSDLRGASQFVIRPVDGSYIMGSDGSEFWITRPNGPVWVTNTYRSLAPALRRRIPNRRILGLATSPNEPLMLEISGLMTLIKRNYDIELVNSPGSPEHHVRATLRSARANVPQHIEFWADSDTGVVTKAVTHWPNQCSRALELVTSEPLHQDWFTTLIMRRTRASSICEPKIRKTMSDFWQLRTCR